MEKWPLILIGAVAIIAACRQAHKHNTIRKFNEHPEMYLLKALLEDSKCQ